MRTLVLIAALGLSFGIAAPWNLARADEIRLQENAPDRHIVVKGDTLWDISETFLKDPWKWPEVWGFNKAEIKNPHLIYPGDVVLLTMEGGKPRLSLRGGGIVKLSPSIRGEPIITKDNAIPSIPVKAIAPFLGRNGIIDPAILADAPRLLGAADERVMMMQSDVVYATHGDGHTQHWSIVRPGVELIDPDTKESLGFESIHVGEAQALDQRSPMSLMIQRGYREIAKEDKLLPTLTTDLESLVPHPPAGEISGKIIAAYGGLAATAKDATIVINRGLRDGVEPGHVFAIAHEGRTVRPEKEMPRHRYVDTKCLKPGKTLTSEFYDPKEMFEDCKETDKPSMLKIKEAWHFSDIGCLKPGAKISSFEFFDPKEVYKPHCRPDDEAVKLPDATVGLAFVYKVYQKVAYALVVQASGPIYLMDVVKKP